MTIQVQLREFATSGEVNSEFLRPVERSMMREAADRIDELETALRAIPHAIDAAAHWIDMRGRVDLIVDKALEASS